MKTWNQIKRCRQLSGIHIATSLPTSRTISVKRNI